MKGNDDGDLNTQEEERGGRDIATKIFSNMIRVLTDNTGPAVVR